eukprot:4008418-Amphidinium_carterae.4
MNCYYSDEHTHLRVLNSGYHCATRMPQTETPNHELTTQVILATHADEAQTRSDCGPQNPPQYRNEAVLYVRTNSAVYKEALTAHSSPIPRGDRNTNWFNTMIFTNRKRKEATKSYKEERPCCSTRTSTHTTNAVVARSESPETTNRPTSWATCDFLATYQRKNPCRIPETTNETHKNDPCSKA